MHTPRRGLATALLLAGMAGPATAQQDPPSPARTMDAYQVLERWVRDWNVPSEPGGDFPVAAASVTLRLDGQVVGRGVDPTASGEALRRAAAAAWAEASERLPVAQDARREASLLAAAGQVMISLELAGPLVPLLGDDLAGAAAEVNPGIHGVAVRVGERLAAMFPGTMLATDTLPAEAARALLNDLFGAEKHRLTGPDTQLRPLAELREHEGVRLYRFAVTHLAQTAPERMPIFLHRGGRIVTLRDINTAAITSLADGIAAHLLERRYLGPEALGMMGTLYPAQGRCFPSIAGPADQAVTALAMRRFAATRGVDVGLAANAAAFADDLLAALAKVEHGEADPAADPATAAACIVAYFEGPAPPPEVEIRMAGLLPSCGGEVRAAFDPETGFAQSAPDAARGLVAWATVRMALRAGDPASRERASLCVRRVFLETPPGGLATHLPWLGFAEAELAGDGAIPSAIALREARELVWAHQYTLADAGADNADLVGGIVFTRGGAALPSWHTARPLAFLAGAMGDVRLTDGAETPRELVRVLGGLRFLRQLAADEATEHMFPPRRALGGIRAALWDQRMPADASAMSLIAACETLRAMDGMRR